MSVEERDEVLRSARQHVMNAYKDIADLPHGNVFSEEGLLLKEQVRALLAAMKRRGLAIELSALSTDRVVTLDRMVTLGKEVEQIKADLETLRDLCDHAYHLGYEEGDAQPEPESEAR